MSVRQRFRVLALGVFTAATGCAPQGSDADRAAPVQFDPNYGAGQGRTLMLDEGEVVYLENGEGPPVVFFGAAPYWQWQVEAVSMSGHVTAFEFSDIALARTPQGLEAALEALDLGAVHLVAHSSTAWTAIQLAAQRPDLFRSLVLEEPAVFDLSGAPAQSCSLTGASESEVAACEFSSQVSGPGWFESWPVEIRQFVSDMLAEANASPPELPPGVELQDIEFPSLCDDELRLAMARHDIPTLFIRGEQTPAFFQAGLDEYEACLPPHASVTVSGASPFVHLDQPAEYNRAIMNFFDQISER